MDAKEIGQWCLDNKAMLHNLLRGKKLPYGDYENYFNEMVCRIIDFGSRYYDESKNVKPSTYFIMLAKQHLRASLLKDASKLSYPVRFYQYKDLSDFLTENENPRKFINLDKMEVVDHYEGIGYKYSLDDTIDVLNRAEKVKKYLNLLPCKWRKVLQLRYDNNLIIQRNLKECAEVLGISKERVNQIEMQAINKLLAWLNEDVNIKGTRDRKNRKKLITGGKIYGRPKKKSKSRRKRYES